MARTRTTKKLAQRIDLNYFKRPSLFKRAKFWLSLLLPVFALAWIGWHSAGKDSRVYSSGRLSEAHAVFEKECSACHLRESNAFSAKAADSACLGCHDGPVHHAGATKKLECATCHSEHRGRVNLSAVREQSCAECHGDLSVDHGSSHYAVHIYSFEDGHPEFAALRDGVRDPETIKLNHSVHMKAIRRGPSGPMVQLQCGDCHQPAVNRAQWLYGDAKYASAKNSYSDQEEILPVKAAALAPHAAMSGRERMAPVKFANACAACHLLTFDKRFEDGVPHDKPEVVHAFVVNKFSKYIAAHPAELHVSREPNRELTGRPVLPEVRVLTPAQWVAERTAEAEELLWRKTCSQCHALAIGTSNSRPAMPDRVARGRGELGVGPAAGPASIALPIVAAGRTTSQWVPHAKFDHDAHRAFACESCHPKALTSTESSEVLLPGIATCQKCHAPGPDHAESRCFECHTYHDWSQRKDMTPRFTIPALRTGGS